MKKKTTDISQSKVEELITNKTSSVDIQLESTIEKQTIIGDFKPKRRFLNFVTGLKGRVRLLSNYAFIKGEQLSGMLEGVVFKITICDEGSINFEEVDSCLTTPLMIQSFIDEIDSRDVTGYTKKFVVTGLEFYDDDAKVCYLEVEHIKPIDKLFSIFDDEAVISESGMSILDELFSSETDVEISTDLEGESDEEILDDSREPNEDLKQASKKHMEEVFRKMNEEKLIELKSRIEKTESEIVKLNYEIKQSESKLDTEKQNLKVLNTRLNSLCPKEDPIGYDFFVSSEIKSDIEPDENLVMVVEKLAPIMKLNVPVVLEMLTSSHFNIKIRQQKTNEEPSDKFDKSILEKISKIDLIGKVTLISSTEFEYRGELSWHQIVDKMVRMGFEQNPEFDKECGSNSYESEEQKNETTKNL